MADSCSLGMTPGSFGRRDSFADIGQTIARHLGIAPLDAESRGYSHYRHPGESRGPLSSVRAISAAQTALIQWIPAFAGMTK